MQYFFADAPMKFFFNLVYEGVQYFLDTQVKNNFFALIKKIFLQALVEIIFRYHKSFFYGSGTLLGPPTNKMNFFACEVMGIKIE